MQPWTLEICITQAATSARLWSEDPPKLAPDGTTYCERSNALAEANRLTEGGRRDQSTAVGGGECVANRDVSVKEGSDG